MKSIFRSVILFILCIFLLGFQAADKKHQLDTGAKIKLSKESHDFGVVQEGFIVEHVFKITNAGNAVLKITKLTGS